MSGEEEKRFYQNYGSHLVARGVQTKDDPEELYRMMLPVARARLKYIGEYFMTPYAVLEIGASAGSFFGALEEHGLSLKNLNAVEPSEGHCAYMQTQLGIETYNNITGLPAGKKYRRPMKQRSNKNIVSSASATPCTLNSLLFPKISGQV